MSSLFGCFILLYVDLCMPLVGPKLEKIKILEKFLNYIPNMNEIKNLRFQTRISVIGNVSDLGNGAILYP